MFYFSFFHYNFAPEFQNKEKRMKRTIAIISAVSLLAVLLASCSNPEKKGSSEEAVKVKAVTVENATVDGGRKYSGTIEENTGTAVSFATAGTVSQVYVSNGQAVNKGQLIATLDPTTLQQAHNTTLAMLNQAKDAYQRMKQLHDSNSISEMQWVDVQSKLEQAQSNEQIARRALADARLVAPASGIISDKTLEPGQNVMPTLAVMKIVDVSKVKVNVSVPENEVGEIRKGSEIGIRVPALGNARFSGIVTEKSVTANLLSRTYDVKATVSNSDRRLMPGMICDATISQPSSIHSHPSAISLPVDAVQLSEKNFYFVWTVLHGKAHKTYVQVGSVTSTGVTITSGLSSGDMVIVEGQQKVSEGSQVK